MKKVIKTFTTLFLALALVLTVGLTAFASDYDQSLIEKYTPYLENLELTDYDMNGDGSSNVKDILILRKYIAKWDVELAEDKGDLNRDGKIDVKDVLIFRVYIAGYSAPSPLF